MKSIMNAKFFVPVILILIGPFVCRVCHVVLGRCNRLVRAIR